MQKIILYPFNINYLETFASEKKLLLQRLGNAIHEIHHVGSTPIADLLSKPIIDIVIEAQIFPPSQEIIKLMATLSYEFKGEAGVEGRFWFTKGEPRLFNLHYCAVGSEIVKNQILFRDALLRDENLRREYENIKLANAGKGDIDSSDYALAKSDLIRKVIDNK